MLSLQNAIREAEWLLSILAELRIKGYQIEKRVDYLPYFIGCIIATDCKSAYDSLAACTPGNASDREVVLDGIEVEQIRPRVGAAIRWLPGSIQLADILTKDQGDAAGYCRDVMHKSEYCSGREEAWSGERC